MVEAENLLRYRIHRLSPTVARLRSSYTGREAAVDPRTLRWDATARLWRTDRCTPTR